MIDRSSKKRNLFRAPRHGAAFALFIIVACVALCVMLIVLDNSRVVVDRQTVTLPALPASAEGFSILLIGDLHGKMYGESQAHITTALDQTRVDAIVLAGDLCAPDGDTEAFFILLDSLAAHEGTANKPVFFLAGDEDPPTSVVSGIERVPSPWVQGAMDRGAVLLDSPQLITIGTARIWFTYGLTPVLDVDGAAEALQDELSTLIKQRDMTNTEQEQRISEMRYSLKSLERTQEMRTLMKPGDLHIGVLHHPLTEPFLQNILRESSEEDLQNFRVLDVMLAAHYCGGGIRLPVIGALHVPAPALDNGGWWPPQQLTRGQAEVSGLLQVVTPGLGVSVLQKPARLRMLNTSAITIVRLTGR